VSMQISEAVKKALTNTEDWSVGTVVPRGTSDATRDEMRSVGLIGPSAGLTRKGSIAAERLQRAQFEELFPL